MRRLPLILATGLLLCFVAGCAESPATPAPTAVPSEAAPVVAAAPARPDAIRRMEDDFIAAEDLDQAAPTRRSIHERMAHYGVPGMGVAVINGGQLLWAGGYGTLSADGDEPVTADTVFSTGSVSKVAQAALVMRLVQAGRLDVDTDVSTYLTRWQVPDGPFTADGPVTLRAILSHTAGFSQHGFADFEPGEALPTALDTLNGAAPAKHGPVRLMFAPGTRMDYSGGGYTVSQVLVEDVTGRAYADLVRSEVFEPLGMSRSTFVNPLPPGHGNIARAHDSRGQPRALPRGYEAMPELAASGLWSSARDLSRLVLALMQDDAFLAPPTRADMLTRVPRSAHGMGPRINGEAPRRVFHHGGANDSYKAWIEGHPELGSGLVVLTNGEAGRVLTYEVRAAVGRALDWPLTFPDDYRSPVPRD